MQPSILDPGGINVRIRVAIGAGVGDGGVELSHWAYRAAPRGSEGPELVVGRVRETHDVDEFVRRYSHGLETAFG